MICNANTFKKFCILSFLANLKQSESDLQFVKVSMIEFRPSATTDNVDNN
jgi:hypothetical protein